ncbi:MAG: hypothetical protein ACE5JJ_08735 [Nitrospinota bacterium]
MVSVRELAEHKLLGADLLRFPARRQLGRDLRVRAAILGRVEKTGENPLGVRVELEWFDFEQDKVQWRGRATYEGGRIHGRASLEEAIGLAAGKLVELLPPARAGAGGKGAPER